jgi:hypothetical protein
MKGSWSPELPRAATLITHPFLNALPGNIALIDSDGRILDASNSWFALAKAGGTPEGNHNDRLNYVRV